jgi:hypothetical protein
MHSQYHTTEHCQIVTPTHINPQQSTVTLVQALTLSYNIVLPLCYRHWHYNRTEHCYFITGTRGTTQQSTATTVQALVLSHNSAGLCLAVAPFLSLDVWWRELKIFFTLVYALDPQDRPLFWLNVRMAAVWHLLSKFHFVFPYSDSTLILLICKETILYLHYKYHK